jgi:hypothetical protein
MATGGPCAGFSPSLTVLEDGSQLIKYLAQSAFIIDFGQNYEFCTHCITDIYEFI